MCLICRLLYIARTVAITFFWVLVCFFYLRVWAWDRHPGCVHMVAELLDAQAEVVVPGTASRTGWAA